MSNEFVISNLEKRRQGFKDSLDALLDAPAREKRDLNNDEYARFSKIRDEVTAIDERLKELRDQERLNEAANLGRRTSGFEVRDRDSVYERGNGQSYFLDLIRHQRFNDPAATQRLMRHGQMMDQRLQDDSWRQQHRAFAAPERETRVNPNRTDGQGGFFVPPLWAVDEYVSFARFGRPTADLARKMSLPPGTDSINLPTVATGTATAIQTADAAAVQSTDMTDSSVSAPVRTIAGQQDIALQLLEQSPVSFDEIVWADLIADYNQKLDLQVISGSGAAGQATGLLTLAGTNAVTYTDATPTLPEMLVPIGQMASKVATAGKAGKATAMVMHPGLWNWALTQQDSTFRPLIDSNTAGLNVIGVQTDGTLGSGEGPAGTILGLPVYLDGNLPVNLGGGTNETRVIAARWNELFLWESQIRTRVLPEVLSGTLQVRLQVYNYFAFLPGRRPACISIGSGTGFIFPIGF